MSRGFRQGKIKPGGIDGSEIVEFRDRNGSTYETFAQLLSDLAAQGPLGTRVTSLENKQIKILYYVEIDGGQTSRTITIPEEAEKKPTSVYGKTKLIIEGILDDYDHEQLDKKGLTKKEANYPSLKDYNSIIGAMLTEFSSDVFGKEKDKSFESAVQQITKGFGDEDFYPTLEEKAATLLYLIVKNHAFVDGNKRIAAACFLKFLEQNGFFEN